MVTFPRWFTRPQRDYSIAEVSQSRFAVLTKDNAMGEVTASPAANTLLARIKAIVTQIAAGIQSNGWVWTTSFGIAGVRFTSADQSAAAASITDAPTSGQKLVIDSVLVAAGATAQICQLSEETSGTIVATVAVPANSTYEWKPTGKIKLATADKKLQLRSSASGNVYATAVYHSEA